jgi:hypothetical protein
VFASFTQRVEFDDLPLPLQFLAFVVMLFGEFLKHLTNCESYWGAYLMSALAVTPLWMAFAALGSLMRTATAAAY